MLRPHSFLAAISLLFVPILDATIKGSAVLLLASVVCLALRRDSAATRHLVWATAVMLLLAMPLMSCLLPQWRVLPNWTRTDQFVQSSSPSGSEPLPGFRDPIERPPSQHLAGANLDESGPIVEPPLTNEPTVTQHSAAPVESASPAAPNLSAKIANQPSVWIPLVWLTGCVLVLLRLIVAALLLRKSEGRCHLASASPEDPISQPDDRLEGEGALLAALDSAKTQMGIRRPVQLLLDPRRSMPVVWGLFRARLRLPAEAVAWSAERQQSVLMHELAHVRRNDLTILMLTQIACALNWFNPLMWLAAWRLHVERERACDDLVLSLGIRPSTYAGHLVDVVSRMRPAGWAQSCGLAMARKSSLESRLVAVLSGRTNRRGLTRLLVAAVFVIGTGITIPVAMLHATVDKQETLSEADEKPVDEPLPKPEESKKLDPNIEEKLQWGEPANGLRAALVRPQALGKPAVEEVFDFRFVVQNVSDAPIRLSTASVAPTRRYLIVRKDGVPLMALHDEKPTRADYMIEPREVAVLRLFSNSTPARSVTADDPAMTYSAEFNIENGPAGSWTGKLVAAEMKAAAAGYGLLPKNKAARGLFMIWNAGVRRNERIPGGLIALLAEGVRKFTDLNPTWKTTPRLLEMLPRLDATRDWSGQEAMALLDDFANVQDTAVKLAIEAETVRSIRTGAPLPPQLANAPWGEAQPNGLRLAWLFEPQAQAYPLNTPLKSRILIHNSGENTVVFRMWTWRQGKHTATVNNSVELEIESTSWLTESRLVPFRLNPGEFVELPATGLGIGAREDIDEWRDTQVGSWIDARTGDEITVTTAPIHFYDRNDNPGWWLEMIKERLARYQPFPADAEERKLLLYRVAMDLFGTPVSAEINAAFVADREPTALDSLAQLLHDRPGTTAFTGSLQSGPTTFRVLPPDPDAAKKPRVVYNTGRYRLGEKINLFVSRRRIGNRISNEAHLRFYPPDRNTPAPGEPYEFKLPNGYNTWAIGWMRNGNTLWLQEKSGYRKVVFSDPAQVKEETVEAEKVPKDIRAALQPTLTTGERQPPELTPSPPPAAINRP